MDGAGRIEESLACFEEARIISESDTDSLREVRTILFLSRLSWQYSGRANSSFARATQRSAENVQRH